MFARKTYVEDVRLCSMLRYHTGSWLAGCADDHNTSRAATSRDWVIEKMTITVTYDADIEKARKIIKKIGLELFEDPEFKATTVEPLKMQGIDIWGTADDPLGIQRKWHQESARQYRFLAERTTASLPPSMRPQRTTPAMESSA